MACNGALIARYADDADGMPRADREWVHAHLASCASCRTALEEQRGVAGLLRGRLETAAGPGLSARVSARIDAEDAGDAGWLGLANWRAWTAGLLPVAGALTIAAFLAGDTTRTESYDATADASTSTFDDWTAPSGSRGPASALLQPGTSGDALLEAVLTGAAPSSTGTPDVR